MQPHRPSSLSINTHSTYCIKNNSEDQHECPENTYCAWKSTSTGRSLLMTLSVKSSLSCTLKEMHLCEERRSEREGDRKDRVWTEVLREEERDEEDVESEAAAAGRRRESFTETAQILLTSSRVAIWETRPRRR